MPSRHPLVAWAVRGAAVLGGVLLLTRPWSTPQEAVADAAVLDRSGRGRPEAPPSPQALKAGHEMEDMSGRTMALLVMGLGGAVACVVGLMVALAGYLDHARDAAQPRYTAQQTAPVVPPGPHLQAAPLDEIAQLHAREDALLQGYAWTDEGHTRARIPIGRAMTLIQGRSLDAPP